MPHDTTKPTRPSAFLVTTTITDGRTLNGIYTRRWYQMNIWELDNKILQPGIARLASALHLLSSEHFL